MRSGPALDEDDPEVQEELFETLKHLGVAPQDIPDQEERSQYAASLALPGHPFNGE